MVKISTSLKNFRDRIRTSISIKAKNILLFIAVLLVVFLAIFIRCSPLISGIRMIKAFDPWIQYYNAEYLSKHEFYEYFHWHDIKSWYPEGYDRGTLRPGLTFTVVIIYKITSFLGLNFSLYDICFFFPAFMGGITVLAIYFLGKEILNPATGLLAAFFLAFSPGYLQRTTAGFFDNETIGVFGVVMTFLFFIKALKTGKFTHSVLGGIFLGYLSLSWGGYQFGFLMLPIICIILILSDKYSENILIAYGGVQGIGLLISSLYYSFAFNSFFSSIEVGGTFLFSIILVIFHIIHSKKDESPDLYFKFISILKWIIIPGFLIFAIIIWIDIDIIPFGLGGRFKTVLSPLLRSKASLTASVAEQMPSAWSVFYYNVLIPLVLVPLGVYFCFKRLFPADIFLICFIILMYYFTGSMIRIILLFAPAAALVGAYGLANILNIFGTFIGEKKAGVSRKRIRQVKGSTLGNPEVAVVYLLVGLLCIVQVVHSTDIARTQMVDPQLIPAGQIHDWEEAFTWMRNNVEGTDVVVSWWDYGYWITPIGNATSVNDNATKNSTRIGLTGMALMQTNERYSAMAFRALKADYVLVYFGLLIPGLGGDEGKWPWMVRICNDHYEDYKKMGMEQDNWQPNSVFNEADFFNASSGKREDAWFESTLAKLMFYGSPTSEDVLQSTDDIRYRYIQTINNEKDDDGDVLKTHIPDGGMYDLNAFSLAYMSGAGLVKIYKLDYTLLDSSFSIEDAEVFDDGHATLKVKNDGIKDLIFSNVSINGKQYDFIMSDTFVSEEGESFNILNVNEEALIYIDTASQGTTFKKDDLVNIKISAQSQEESGEDYAFSESTNNFFVKEAELGKIKINRQNSQLIQINSSHIEATLEIENTGENIVLLDRIYVGNDTAENTINSTNIEYLNGSPLLAPGDKATIFFENSSNLFYPIGSFNKIGITTFQANVYDEVLFTSSMENYSLSILSDDRIIAPERSAYVHFYDKYRDYIPFNYDMTHAITYDNGSTIVKILVKNTGDIIFGLDSIYITESLIEVTDYSTKNGSVNLGPNEEELITFDAKDYISEEIEVNDEIFIGITGSHGNIVTSDAGYIRTINDEPDIQIVPEINALGYNASVIFADETAELIIKNTGNESISLENVYINNILITDFSYIYLQTNDTYIVYDSLVDSFLPSAICTKIYSDSPTTISDYYNLDIQESIILGFYMPYPNININKSNEVSVKITTNTSLELIKTMIVEDQPLVYSIEIIDEDTSAEDDGDLKILILSTGILGVNIESIYINNYYFSWGEFVSIDKPPNAQELTIDMTKVEAKIGPINVNDSLEILVRTKQGAEATHTEIVV